MKISGVEASAIANWENYVDPGQNQIKPKDVARTGEPDSQGDKNQQYTVNQLKQSVDALNKTMETYKTDLKFELHEKSGEYMIKVLKESDGSVIREIPPKKVLDMVAYFKELLGIIVDKMI